MNEIRAHSHCASCYCNMPPAGYEALITAVERPQTHALDIPVTRVNQSLNLYRLKTQY